MPKATGSAGSATRRIMKLQIEKNMGSSFVEKVAKMRTLQNEYAKTRNSLTLKAAKKAEKEVDEALTLRFANFTPASEDEQHPKLFDV